MKGQVSILGFVMLVLIIMTVTGLLSEFLMEQKELVVEKIQALDIADSIEIAKGLLAQERLAAVEELTHLLGSMGGFEKAKSDCGEYLNTSEFWIILESKIPYWKNVDETCIPDDEKLRILLEFLLNKYKFETDAEAVNIILNYLEERGISAGLWPIFKAEVVGFGESSVGISFIPKPTGDIDPRDIIKFQAIKDTEEIPGKYKYSGSTLVYEAFPDDFSVFKSKGKTLVENGELENWVRDLLEEHAKFDINISVPVQTFISSEDYPNLTYEFISRDGCVFFAHEACLLENFFGNFNGFPEPNKIIVPEGADELSFYKTTALAKNSNWAEDKLTSYYYCYKCKNINENSCTNLTIDETDSNSNVCNLCFKSSSANYIHTGWLSDDSDGDDRWDYIRDYEWKKLGEETGCVSLDSFCGGNEEDCCTSYCNGNACTCKPLSPTSTDLSCTSNTDCCTGYFCDFCERKTLDDCSSPCTWEPGCKGLSSNNCNIFDEADCPSYTGCAWDGAECSGAFDCSLISESLCVSPCMWGKCSGSSQCKNLNSDLKEKLAIQNNTCWLLNEDFLKGQVRDFVKTNLKYYEENLTKRDESQGIKWKFELLDSELKLESGGLEDFYYNTTCKDCESINLFGCKDFLSDITLTIKEPSGYLRPDEYPYANIELNNIGNTAEFNVLIESTIVSEFIPEGAAITAYTPTKEQPYKPLLNTKTLSGLTDVIESGKQKSVLIQAGHTSKPAEFLFEDNNPDNVQPTGYWAPGNYKITSCVSLEDGGEVDPDDNCAEGFFSTLDCRDYRNQAEFCCIEKDPDEIYLETLWEGDCDLAGMLNNPGKCGRWKPKKNAAPDCCGYLGPENPSETNIITNPSAEDSLVGWTASKWSVRSDELCNSGSKCFAPVYACSGYCDGYIEQTFDPPAVNNGLLTFWQTLGGCGVKVTVTYEGGTTTEKTFSEAFRLTQSMTLDPNKKITKIRFETTRSCGVNLMIDDIELKGRYYKKSWCSTDGACDNGNWITEADNSEIFCNCMSKLWVPTSVFGGYGTSTTINIIKNPGAEDGLTNWASNTWSIKTDNYKSGLNCFATQSAGYIEQTFSPAMQNSGTLIFWQKDGCDGDILRVIVTYEDNSVTSQLYSWSETYVQKSLALNSNKKISKIRFETTISCPSSGLTYIDDISIVGPIGSGACCGDDSAERWLDGDNIGMCYNGVWKDTWQFSGCTDISNADCIQGLCEQQGKTWVSSGSAGYRCCGDDGAGDDWVLSTGVCSDGIWHSDWDCLQNLDCYTYKSKTDGCKNIGGIDKTYTWTCDATHKCVENPVYSCLYGCSGSDCASGKWCPKAWDCNDDSYLGLCNDCSGIYYCETTPQCVGPTALAPTCSFTGKYWYTAWNCWSCCAEYGPRTVTASCYTSQNCKYSPMCRTADDCERRYYSHWDCGYGCGSYFCDKITTTDEPDGLNCAEHCVGSVPKSCQCSWHEYIRSCTSGICTYSYVPGEDLNIQHTGRTTC